MEDITLDTNPVEIEIATENVIAGESRETGDQNHQGDGR